MRGRKGLRRGEEELVDGKEEGEGGVGGVGVGVLASDIEQCIH